MTNQQQFELPRADKDMADKFVSDLDSFLVNFTETWEDVVDIRSIMMTTILVLQKFAVETAEIMYEDAAKGGLDILDKIQETLAERCDKVRLKHPDVVV